MIRFALLLTTSLVLGGAQAVAQAPNLSSSNVLATGSTTARSLATIEADYINVLNGYSPTAGAKCDGVTDDSAAFTAVGNGAASAGKTMIIPGGVCIVNSWTLPTTPLFIQGAGVGVTILKRAASASGNSNITGSACHGINIKDMTLDGNNANNSTSGFSLLFTSCYNVHVDHVEVKNSKGSGAAIQFVTTADLANGTRSYVTNSYIHDNDGSGIYFQGSASNWSVQNNIIRNNGMSGVTLINFVFPPVADSFDNWAINDNDISYNGGGIGITSFITGGSSGNPVAGVFATAHHGMISRNMATHNTGYGIQAQGVDIEVASNVASYNGGTGSVYAGILANGSQLDIHDNTADNNEFYGIDAGGSTNTKIHDNTTSFNGNATANNGVGINCGACQNTDIESNLSSSNGTSAAGSQIRVSLYDGGATIGAGFPTAAQYVAIRKNHVISAFGTQLGVWVTQNPQNMIIEDNWSEGAGDFQAYVLESTLAQIHRNRQDTWFVEKAVNLGNSFYTFPDGLDELTVQSAPSNTVNAFWPAFYSNYTAAVFATVVTAPGSNYSNTVTITFSGGSCGVEPTASVYTDGNGHVLGVVMLTPGSGCTGTPTAAFTDGTGSGATVTVEKSSTLPVNGREFRVIFPGGVTVNYGSSNLLLQGNANFTVPTGVNIVSTFQGWLGKWVEIARYGSIPTAPPPIPQGRLTLTSGTPVMSADASAQTTVYYDSYVGASVPNAVGTMPIPAGEVSMGLSAANHLSGTVYDVFGIVSSGALALCTGPAWSSTTSRGTGAGTTQIHNSLGYWTNVVALTHCYGGAAGTTDYGSVAIDQGTYLGSFYATANGQTGMKFAPAAASGGTASILGLYNGYNRVPITSRSQDSSASWTDATATTWRAANNSASARVSWLDGLQQSSVIASYQALCSSSSSGTAIGVTADSITATPAAVAQGPASTITTNLMASANFSPLLGFHYVSAMEDDLGGTATCFGAQSYGQVSSLVIQLPN